MAAGAEARAGLCEVCGRVPMKYTCPKCGAVYCSAECFRGHGRSCTEAFFRELAGAEARLRQREAARAGGDEATRQMLLREHEQRAADEGAFDSDGEEGDRAAGPRLFRPWWLGRRDHWPRVDKPPPRPGDASPRGLACVAQALFAYTYVLHLCRGEWRGSEADAASVLCRVAPLLAKPADVGLQSALEAALRVTLQDSAVRTLPEQSLRCLLDACVLLRQHDAAKCALAHTNALLTAARRAPEADAAAACFSELETAAGERALAAAAPRALEWGRETAAAMLGGEEEAADDEEDEAEEEEERESRDGE